MELMEHFIANLRCFCVSSSSSVSYVHFSVTVYGSKLKTSPRI